MDATFVFLKPNSATLNWFPIISLYINKQEVWGGCLDEEPSRWLGLFQMPDGGKKKIGLGGVDEIYSTAACQTVVSARWPSGRNSFYI